MRGFTSTSTLMRTNCPECLAGISRRTNKHGRMVHTIGRMKDFGDVKVLCSKGCDEDGIKKSSP